MADSTELGPLPTLRRALSTTASLDPATAACFHQRCGVPVSQALGILHKEDGVSMRATYIVDPQGIIRFVNVTDMNVGRNVDEVVRVLDALQTDELCPCNWEKGEPTLQVA